MGGRRELGPGGWSPVTPSLLRPDASVLGGDQGLHLRSRRGPASALASPEPAPTRGLRLAAQPVGRAALYLGPVQTSFLSPLSQDDQSGPQELPRAHLQCARGCCADKGAARWVPRAGAALWCGLLRGAPVGQAARVAGLVPPRGHSCTWSFAHEETEGGPQGGGGLPALELGWPGPAGCSEQGPTLNPPTRSPACPWVGQQSTVFIPLGLSRSFLLTPAPQPPVAQL